MSRRAMMVKRASGGGLSPGFKTITVDHSKAGGTDTSNFMMLVHETIPALKSIANGGAVGTVNDIRCGTDNAAASLLTWKVVLWNAATGEVTLLVNIGTLSHTVDPVWYLVYDGASRGSFLGGNPSDSNFKLAIPGGDGTTLDLSDISGNSNNGTNPTGRVAAAAGPNGLGAMEFFGSGEYVRTPNTLNLAHVTVEALVYMPAYPGGTSRAEVAGFVMTNDGGPVADKNLSINYTGVLSFYVFDGGTKEAVSTGLVGTGAWVYLMGKADGTNVKTLINGAVDGSVAAGNTYTGYTAPGVEIQGKSGGSVGTASTWAMKVSMVRVSDVARSDDYALATKNSFLSPSTFYTVT